MECVGDLPILPLHLPHLPGQSEAGIAGVHWKHLVLLMICAGDISLHPLHRPRLSGQSE
jgi:hypothetical protein